MFWCPAALQRWWWPTRPLPDLCHVWRRSYEFVAALENVRVKVIVKQVLGGAPRFWSIIPNWKLDKNTGNRKLHTGTPAED